MQTTYTRPEVVTALLNLEWMLKNPREESDGIDVPTWTYQRGGGGGTLDELFEAGFTPATRLTG